MKWIRDYWFKVGILIVFLAAAAFICFVAYYHYMVYLPKRDSEQEFSAQEQRSYQEQRLQDCLGQVQRSYQNDLTDYYSNGGPIYSPAKIELDNSLKSNQDTCIKEYK